MRLHDTLTGTLVELPPPPEPIGMYVCGPTVYQRAHIGNARPFVVFMWLARWLRARGYEVRLVHNITDVNDKIYEAAPGHSAERALEVGREILRIRRLVESVEGAAPERKSLPVANARGDLVLFSERRERRVQDA